MNLTFEANLMCRVCEGYINRENKLEDKIYRVNLCNYCTKKAYEKEEKKLLARYKKQEQINKLINNQNSFLAEAKELFVKLQPEGDFNTWLQQPYWNNKKLTVLKAFEEGEGQKIVDALQCLIIGNIGA